MDVGIEEGVEDGVDAARVFTKREFTKWPSPPKRELLTLATFEWQRAIRLQRVVRASNLPEQHEHERTGMAIWGMERAELLAKIYLIPRGRGILDTGCVVEKTGQS